MEGMNHWSSPSKAGTLTCEVLPRKYQSTQTTSVEVQKLVPTYAICQVPPKHTGKYRVVETERFASLDTGNWTLFNRTRMSQLRTQSKIYEANRAQRNVYSLHVCSTTELVCTRRFD